MISGHNFIGFEKKATGEKKLHAFSTLLKNNLQGEFIAATEDEIQEAIEKATLLLKFTGKLLLLKEQIFGSHFR
jgi:hypothetical protein